jgi:hypothetical protein
VLDPGQSATFEVTITNVSAPAGEWRFGRLVWRDTKGRFEVKSPMAVRAKAVVAPEVLNETGTEGSTSFDVAFGYNGPYSAGAHGLQLPFLSLFEEVPDDPNNAYVFNGPNTVLSYLLETAPGALTAQWALYDAYDDGDHDFDMYVYHCPDFLCTLVGASAGLTSQELVRINNPVNDPNVFDPYVVFLHPYETDGGAPASLIQFDWTDPAVDADLGNMMVSGPSTATLGGTGTVNIDWAGLIDGAAAKYLGAVSHSDSAGIQDLTIIGIENDAGAGFCDLIDCN